VGESVTLCVEFNTSSLSTGNYSNISDIEDCALPDGNISGLEPHVARGTISSVDVNGTGSVAVKLKEVSKRFARYLHPLMHHAYHRM
jgi:hypothetical protein